MIANLILMAVMSCVQVGLYTAAAFLVSFTGACGFYLGKRLVRGA